MQHLCVFPNCASPNTNQIVNAKFLLLLPARIEHLVWNSLQYQLTWTETPEVPKIRLKHFEYRTVWKAFPTLGNPTTFSIEPQKTTESFKSLIKRELFVEVYNCWMDRPWWMPLSTILTWVNGAIQMQHCCCRPCGQFRLCELFFAWK